VGIILSLGVLAVVFHETTSHSPAVNAAGTAACAAARRPPPIGSLFISLVYCG
jgi:hypothetical protein